MSSSGDKPEKAAGTVLRRAVAVAVSVRDFLRKIFNDWLTRGSAIILLLTVVLVIFNFFSDLPEEHPLFGVLNFSLVPILIVAGGIVFSLAIVRYSRWTLPLKRVLGTTRERRAKLLFLVFGGVIATIALIAGGYQLVEFTESVAFCGRICHDIMNPTYTAYTASPHSRVPCADCHIGAGAEFLVKSKISGTRELINTITGNYERPLSDPVSNLRPARDICEQCHRPERFAGDLVRVHTTYATDEANTEKIDTRVLRVGGGEAEVARDIHWHIAAEVWYLPLDEKRQEIGWVGVGDGNGNLTEYVYPPATADITQERLEEEKRLMDCIDCHNRATHIFQSPEELIDKAMLTGKIDKGLPFIKREGSKALDPPNPSLERAIANVEAIKQFYRTSYPQVYNEQQPAIDAAVTELGEIARLTTFPYMRVTWDTHVDNATHDELGGCFRCHGKLIGTAGAQKDRAIDADCTLCHYFELP
ncbi:NapC/NirT family cytochrome c [Chloroflexota bacterium]